MTPSLAVSNASSTQVVLHILLILFIDLLFKIIGGEPIDASIISIGLSQKDNVQIVFRSIWMPVKKSTGPVACQQRVNVKKYYELRRNRNMMQQESVMLEDVEWSDLCKLGQGCTDYQLLFRHPYDGLLRIKLDSFSGKQGRQSKDYTLRYWYVTDQCTTTNPL